MSSITKQNMITINLGQVPHFVSLKTQVQTFLEMIYYRSYNKLGSEPQYGVLCIPQAIVNMSSKA